MQLWKTLGLSLPGLTSISTKTTGPNLCGMYYLLHHQTYWPVPTDSQTVLLPSSGQSNLCDVAKLYPSCVGWHIPIFGNSFFLTSPKTHCLQRIWHQPRAEWHLARGLSNTSIARRHQTSAFLQEQFQGKAVWQLSTRNSALWGEVNCEGRLKLHSCSVNPEWADTTKKLRIL